MSGLSVGFYYLIFFLAAAENIISECCTFYDRSRNRNDEFNAFKNDKSLLHTRKERENGKECGKETEF